ncbi:MAG: D-alanine--D-alanine ligase family protein [Gammaproteobacteria bacterium]
MKQTKKIRVAVLFGGRSTEHEVSLRSATNVIQHIDMTHFDIVPVGIDKQGSWFLGQDVFTKSVAQQSVPQLTQNNQTWFTPEWVGKSVTQTDANELEEKMFDVVFPVVHGTFCEDGTLQGLLELADLPYVGCGVLASSIGMDKDVSKRLAGLAGVNVAPYLVIKHGQWLNQSSDWIKKVTDTISYPAFVKPANAGSSIGITKVKSEQQLAAAIDEAFKFDTKILIEKALNVQELELAVLESLEPGADPIVSVVGEIRPSHEFYSYDAKYVDDNGAQLFIPAPVSDELAEQARLVAKKIFAALECEGMARVDLFLDRDTQTIYFNEINTIPGFTKISMYPKLMEASGVSYAALLTHLIQLAIARHEAKNKLIRSHIA